MLRCANEEILRAPGRRNFTGKDAKQIIDSWPADYFGDGFAHIAKNGTDYGDIVAITQVCRNRRSDMSGFDVLEGHTQRAGALRASSPLTAYYPLAYAGCHRQLSVPSQEHRVARRDKCLHPQ